MQILFGKEWIYSILDVWFRTVIVMMIEQTTFTVLRFKRPTNSNNEKINIWRKRFKTADIFEDHSYLRYAIPAQILRFQRVWQRIGCLILPTNYAKMNSIMFYTNVFPISCATSSSSLTRQNTRKVATVWSENITLVLLLIPHISNIITHISLAALRTVHTRKTAPTNSISMAEQATSSDNPVQVKVQLIPYS